jgi:hypothetical protein
VEDLVHFGTSGRVAAFFSETIQGVGGAVPLADGYLPAVYKVTPWRWGPGAGACLPPGAGGWGLGAGCWGCWLLGLLAADW